MEFAASRAAGQADTTGALGQVIADYDSDASSIDADAVLAHRPVPPRGTGLVAEALVAAHAAAHAAAEPAAEPAARPGPPTV